MTRTATSSRRSTSRTAAPSRRTRSRPTRAPSTSRTATRRRPHRHWRAIISQLSGRSERPRPCSSYATRSCLTSSSTIKRTEAYIAVEMEKTYWNRWGTQHDLAPLAWPSGIARAHALAGAGSSACPTMTPPPTPPRSAAQGSCGRHHAGTRRAPGGQHEHGQPGYWLDQHQRACSEGDFSQDTIVQSGLKIATTLGPTWDAAQSAVERISTRRAPEDSSARRAPGDAYIKMVGRSAAERCNVERQADGSSGSSPQAGTNPPPSSTEVNNGRSNGRGAQADATAQRPKSSGDRRRRQRRPDRPTWASRRPRPYSSQSGANLLLPARDGGGLRHPRERWPLAPSPSAR